MYFIGQTLDSTLMGNKLRFINHQADPFANCLAKLMLCNSVQRIGMFALKDIEIGEEMYFNYGPSFAAKFDLIKMNHDGPPTIEHPPKQPPSTIKPPRHSKRSVELSSSSSNGVNPYRQMKNTLSKNGLRIGRPPKNPVNDNQASSTAMLNSEDPLPVPGRKRDKRNSKKRRRSEAVLDEDSEDEEYIDPHLSMPSRPYWEDDSDQDNAISAVEESEDSGRDMEDLKRVLSTRGSRRGQVGSDSEEEPTKQSTTNKTNAANDDATQESSSLVEESQEEMRIAATVRAKPRKPRKDKGIPRGPMKNTGKRSATSSARRRKSRKAEENANTAAISHARRVGPAPTAARKNAPSLPVATVFSLTPATAPKRRLKLLFKGNKKDNGKTTSSPLGLDGAGDEKPSDPATKSEDEEQEEEEEGREESSPSEEEYEDAEEEVEEYETPQKRGWRTRHANMAREKAARERERERTKAGRKKRGGWRQTGPPRKSC